MAKKESVSSKVILKKKGKGKAKKHPNKKQDVKIYRGQGR